MEIIAFSNQKGGTGKSTTAATVAAGLYRRGYKVLLIDADPQGNTSYSSGAETNTEKNLYSVLMGMMTAAEAVQETESGDVIVSFPGLAKSDLIFTDTGREYVLREAIKPLKRRYDFILIDCPPSLGILTVNALTAADSVIIPAGADAYSIQGVMQLTKTVDTIRKYANKKLQIKGILLTQYNPRTTLSQNVLEALTATAEKLDTKVFNAKIRSSTKVKEAQTVKKDLFTHAPRAGVTADYNQLIDEILE